MDVLTQLKGPQEQQSLNVSKPIPLNYDLGLLTATDINPPDSTQLNIQGKQLDQYLLEYSRDGIQLLVNQIFHLPTVIEEEGIIASLPVHTTLLPREKPVPKPKPLTRWEKFAKAKGIRNKKRERMVYNEATDTYKPRYGYKSASNEQHNQWLIEVPGNTDPEQDQFQLRREEKRKRIQKNEQQRVRNIHERSNSQENPANINPKSSLIDVKKPPLQDSQTNQKNQNHLKTKLNKVLQISKVSTASMGKFDTKLVGEPKPKGMRHQRQPTTPATTIGEKQSSVSILNSIVNSSNAKKDKVTNVVNARKNFESSNQQTRKKVPDQMKTIGFGFPRVIIIPIWVPNGQTKRYLCTSCSVCHNVTVETILWQTRVLKINDATSQPPELSTGPVGWRYIQLVACQKVNI